MISEYQKRNQLKKEEIKILDFGCGRGRSVLKLKLEGYNAYGVDVDLTPIQNGSSLFQHYGYETDKYLFEIDDGCYVPFQDAFFDIVFSEQVVEHVRNIDLFFEEIARVTKAGGMTFHAFPFKYHFTEQHLYMPAIHWLPKNSFRKYAILFWLQLGKDPNWKELSNNNKFQKAERYFNYSINKTYYRSNNYFNNLLRSVGFDVRVKNLKHTFNIRHLNSYFPHTTQIIATKSS